MSDYLSCYIDFGKMGKDIDWGGDIITYGDDKGYPCFPKGVLNRRQIACLDHQAGDVYRLEQAPESLQELKVGNRNLLFSIP